MGFRPPVPGASLASFGSSSILIHEANEFSREHPEMGTGSADGLEEEQETRAARGQGHGAREREEGAPAE